MPVLYVLIVTCLERSGFVSHAGFDFRGIACDMEHPKHKTIRFRKNKYDMTDDLVYTTLHDV